MLCWLWFRLVSIVTVQEGEGEGKGEEAIGGKGIRMKKRGEGRDREVARNRGKEQRG